MDDGVIGRSDLPRGIARLVRDKERDLRSRCSKLWVFTNRKGERFIFGNYTRGRGDSTTVTVSRFEPMIGGWIWA